MHLLTRSRLPLRIASSNNLFTSRLPAGTENNKPVDVLCIEAPLEKALIEELLLTVVGDVGVVGVVAVTVVDGDRLTSFCFLASNNFTTLILPPLLAISSAVSLSLFLKVISV